MAIYKETFNSLIINNERENKLLDFEKNFLIKFLKSDLNLGKLFEKKIGRYFQIIIAHKKRKIDLQFSGKDPKKLILASAGIDFVSWDYLEDKYIVLGDSTDKKNLKSKILTLKELKK